jgi:hypothetical protein
MQAVERLPEENISCSFQKASGCQWRKRLISSIPGTGEDSMGITLW